MAVALRIPATTSRNRKQEPGYTVLELSIVLVIIGLIVGGIITGKDLIRTAAVRSQIAQINKYNSAVNTFDTKYGGLPGDLLLATASTNSFVTNGCDGKSMGLRNGDRLIQGSSAATYGQFHGETELFWQDLGTTGLIGSVFPANGAAARDCTFTDVTRITTTADLYAVADFLPPGKIGYNQYLYVYSNNGDNYFGLSTVTGSKTGSSVTLMSNYNLPVIVASNIDQKTDDGLPLSGNVLAQYLTNNAVSAAPNTSSATATNCYDTASSNYDMGFNNGLGQNCALSFKIQ